MARWFGFVLSVYLLSVFDKGGDMRKAKQSKGYVIFQPLQNAKLNTAGESIIDGGFLLHCVLWPSSSTIFGKICDTYPWYIDKHFGSHCHIVCSSVRVSCHGNSCLNTKSHDESSGSEKER